MTRRLFPCAVNLRGDQRLSFEVQQVDPKTQTGLLDLFTTYKEYKGLKLEQSLVG